MAKFTFPITEDQFKSVLKPEAAKLFVRLGNAEDPLGRAFSCIRQGYLSKLYHKDSTGTVKEENKIVRAAMKNDPALRAQLLAAAARKTT